MARLIVAAQTYEPAVPFGGELQWLYLGVSVSRADDGTPVTGLAAENFRVASDIGVAKDVAVQVGEWQWQPDDREPSGCYNLKIPMTGKKGFTRDGRFIFCIQVRTFRIASPGLGIPAVEDQGQTIIELISR
jgi:hypothetical protein